MLHIIVGKTKSAASGRRQTFIFALLPLAGLSWELVYSGPAKEHVCEGLKPGCSYQTRIYCLSEGGQSPVSHSALAHMHSTVSLATRIQKLWQPVGFFFIVVVVVAVFVTGDKLTKLQTANFCRLNVRISGFLPR